ncbi:unnamed protein product, partial [Iphiclides podalirius]
MQASVMKHFITYLLCLHSCTIVFSEKEMSSSVNETKVRDTQFIQFPDDNGEVHFIEVRAIPSNTLSTIVNFYSNKYFLYTRQSDLVPERLIMNDVNSIESSNFNESNPTVVVVHGWTGNLRSGVNDALRSAFLSISDYNVIILDWSRVASKDYVTAVAAVPRVGQRLGQFLTFLSSATGVSLKSMHLIGHSLGAHVVGNAGRNLGGRVARITGLDPAGPLWTQNNQRLRKTDAVYVEAIHTNSGTFGIVSADAAADFYPNGGTAQPGCATDVCSHKRSWELFESSVDYNELEGHKCSSTLQYTANSCRGMALKMGNGDLNKRGSGVYYLTTTGEYPF